MTETLVRPSRRSFVRAAAWSVPVVSIGAAAPAFAVSPCASTGFSTMNLINKTGTDGTTVQVASTLVGGVTAGPDNLTTSNNFPVDGWLELQNNPLETTETNPSIYQDVKFTFSKSVFELQFIVSDLDSFGGGGNHTYWDRIAVLTPGAAFTAAPVTAGNTAVTGAGTLASPLRQTAFTQAASTPNNLAARQMRVAFAAPTTEMTVRFWSSRSNNKAGTHAVWIGNMQYKKTCS